MPRTTSPRIIALLPLAGLVVCAQSLYAQQSPGAAQPPPPHQAQKETIQGQPPLNGMAAVVNDAVITMDQVKELTGAQEDTLVQ